MKAKLNKRKRWEDALNKFLLSWKGKPEVFGALVSGSRVLGTDTQNSDIDIHIVLAGHVVWRERGNCIVDGYLIEYFSNSLAQLKEYRKDDFKSFTHTDARMFALGRIVFDKTGALRKLQLAAQKELKIKFRKLSKAEIELGKYSLWDELDNLKDLREASSTFYPYSHHLLLNRILDLYRKYLGVEVSASSKLERYFTDTSFRQRYGIGGFQDLKFVRLFVGAVEKQTFDSIEKLVEHVLVQMGGFKVDGWKLRSKSTVVVTRSKIRK